MRREKCPTKQFVPIHSIAAKLFCYWGKHIRLARKELKFSERDLADRADIYRATLQKVEKGDLKCEIGIFFELATLVRVKLFEVDLSQSRRLALDLAHLDGKIALRPKSIRKSTKEVDDAF